MNMKVLQKIFLIVNLAIASQLVNAQEDTSKLSYYQITSVWYVSTADTVDISHEFSNDYFFAFFIENEDGRSIFTIRTYSSNEVVCLGEIILNSVEREDEYEAYVYSSNVFCDPEQEEPASSIIIENIPGSKDETGLDYYYIWMIMNPDEALVFQCFDASQKQESEE